MRWLFVALMAGPVGCFVDGGLQTTAQEVTTSGGTTAVDAEPAVCGDGVVEGWEACDGGPECREDCVLHRCGDGIVAPDVEACDAGELEGAGNGARGSGCTASCAENVCGDGHVGPGEACDDPDDPGRCGPDCRFVGCNDGVEDGSGECEDGNTDDTDLCTSLCTLARCGDGVVQAGVEECDDGNLDRGDGCTEVCMAARCGDGRVQAGVEQCDDGNLKGDDSCSPACTLDRLLVFVSSVRYTGALGGLAGADAKCQALATTAGLPGEFKAWLSDGVETPMTRFKHGLPYVRVDKQLVAEDLAGLSSMSMLGSPIAMTEHGVVITEASDCDDVQDKVWTNVDSEGAPGGSFDCAGWTRTDGLAPMDGGIGAAHAIDAGWSDGPCEVTCAARLGLYCFQQML